jgi:C-terminal processing protease CtpA/Prc
LQDYGKAGQMTRELLKSKDMYDFFSGTATLSCLLFDGGHTYTDLTTINELDSTFTQKLKPIRETKLEEFYGYCPEYLPIKQAKEDNRALRKELDSLRVEKIGKDVRYTKVGNTAYCHFNSFMCDDSGWRKFYKGEGPKPTIEQYPNDWLVILVDALEKAQNDPEVENFILDTSTNGGGSSDVVVFITSIFANKPDMYYENVLTGQKMKSSYEVDRNLDGKFDEKDKDVKLKMNIGVLISSYSFSCGNLLPALLKDYGICLLGMKSGGGSCCVLYNPSADGFGYRYSTHRARLNNLKGQNIDAGIEPDYQLEPDEFFDIEKVGKLIEQFYAK